MIKKEVAEIKKQFNQKRSTITRVKGCYVGGEKQQIARLDDSFLSLPEEESFKYFELLSKTLSGSIGKNLLNMEYPVSAEETGGCHEFLLKLRDSELKDDALLDEFYDRVITEYEYAGNYLILIVYASYDVPGKTGDGLEMDDASEEVYNFILCSICPVELDKSSLAYNPTEGHFSARERDWIVEKPVNGFLFPAFNDRSSDIHALLYYSKKAEEINENFLENFIGAKIPLTPGNQKESFKDVLENGLGEGCSYDLVRNVQEKVSILVAENKEEPAPVILEKDEVLDILSKSGVSDDRLDEFEKCYDEIIGSDASLQATNIVDTGKMKVKTSAVEIKCKPEDAGLLETRIIDGRRCIVIPLDNGVEVNGIKVNPGRIETGE